MCLVWRLACTESTECISGCCVFILKIAFSSLTLELLVLVVAVADNCLYQPLSSYLGTLDGWFYLLRASPKDELLSLSTSFCCLNSKILAMY